MRIDQAGPADPKRRPTGVIPAGERPSTIGGAGANR
jgi:hypothetical protein